jgi:acyl-CoA thioester hydrolase
MNHFRYYLRVRYAECDAQKVVFNGRYGEYVDLAVTEYFRALDLGDDLINGAFDYQVVRQTTEWRAPARYDNVLELSVSTKHMGNTSFSTLVEFRIAGETNVLATSETVYVNVDPQTLTKQVLPENVRAALGRGASGKHVDHAGHFKI